MRAHPVSTIVSGPESLSRYSNTLRKVGARTDSFGWASVLKNFQNEAFFIEFPQAPNARRQRSWWNADRFGREPRLRATVHFGVGGLERPRVPADVEQRRRRAVLG